MNEVNEFGIPLVEMANLRRTRTGLPMVVHAYGDGKGVQHGPRLKVNVEHGDKWDVADTAVVTISDTPRVIQGKLSSDDFELVADFITLNLESLLKYWNNAVDTEDFLNSIKKI